VSALRMFCVRIMCFVCVHQCVWYVCMLCLLGVCVRAWAGAWVRGCVLRSNNTWCVYRKCGPLADFQRTKKTGSVIGKAGATINSIKETSGARVKVSSNQETFPGTSDRIVSVHTHMHMHTHIHT